MDVRMDGRVALITGASMGLGLAMAERFAESGAHVALVARREAPLKEALERLTANPRVLGQTKLHYYTCDVSDASEINRLVASVEADLGPVDILVNNAGHAKAGAFETLTDEEWQKDLDLKLFAVVRLCRLIMPGMRQRKWGRIINVLNTFAKTPAAGTAPTSVTRAAGMALTKVLAGEGAADNVLVNALNIGQIKSDQIRRMHRASGSDMTFDEFVDRAGSRLPMGRMGEAEECANLACFLCSEQGSYISGTSINVDGNASPAL